MGRQDTLDSVEIRNSGADSVRAASRRRGVILLLLDFDGTLAPIVPHPDAAAMPPATRDVMRALARSGRVSIAVISGRALDDLRARVGIDGITYTGNHGFEIQGPGIFYIEPRADALAPELARLCDELARNLGRIPGAFVEYKRLTASVHFRNVRPELEGVVGGVVHRIAGDPRFAISNGNRIFEIRPRLDWNKGTVVQILRKRTQPRRTIYIGDDRTDEDAFRALPCSITIRVGDSAPTAARYRLRDPADVSAFLSRLARWTVY